MKVLWIINAPFPSAAAALGIQSSGFPTWIEAAHYGMLALDGIDLSVAFPSKGEPRSAIAEGSTFATFPPVEFGHERDGLHAITELIRRLSPDLVHIFGTEGGHAHAAAQVCIRLEVPYVVGIQGLSSTIAQHYLSGLPAVVSYGFTVRDLIRRDNTAMQAAKYRARGFAEVKTLALSNYVIGRTSWDRAVSGLINPEARYFTVPETLRSTFYASQWSMEACQPHSIFVSQGHYPIKGLHFVLRALPMIVDRHPDTQLFVSGLPIQSPGVKGRIMATRYSRYLTHLIKESGMRRHVHFVGVLDETAMARQYLKSHVFVSASTVENESNSLSEAKLLGVPTVGSYVGGVVDRIDHGVTGFFYQHDAPYMLAHYVNTLFQDTQLCERIGASARESSLQLNNAQSNSHLLRDAYVAILKDAPKYVLQK